MPLALSTRSGAPSSTIHGVGVLPADGRGGISLTRAAKTMHELQDGDGKPLTGAPLKAAAEKYAKAQNLDVGNVAEPSLDDPPDRTGDARERMERAAARGRVIADPTDTAPADPTAASPAATAPPTTDPTS